jgi:hypothetical protein
MGKLFGLVMLLAALYIGMTLYTQGMESAFGGVFAPIEPADPREAPSATHLTPAAQLADAPSERRHRVKVTDAVRERVTADLAEGARRRGY